MTAVEIEPVAFRGWPHALRLANGKIELIVTLDVGPRILSYSLQGGVNVFNIYEDQTGGSGEPQWRNRGGHRLWLAPESPDFSLWPDNHPVVWELLGKTGVRLTPPPEIGPGFQKQIDLILLPDSAVVTVIHRIIRTGAQPCRAAPWALSVMAAGGYAIIPQPPLGDHPRDLLPNRRLIIWPYTELSDPRYGFGRRFLTLRQDPASRPTKIGMPSDMGWAGYWLQQTLFIKRFDLVPNAEYPDDGCNLEVFTNARMLELETLGPLRTFSPGDQAELTEHWELHGSLPAMGPHEKCNLDAYFSAVVPNAPR